MMDFFTKNGSGYYTNRDIYDDNGILLLGKGQRITTDIRNKLQRRGVRIPGEDEIDNYLKHFASDRRHSDEIISVSQQLKERINIRDDKLLEKPNEILINIIFESKNKPWWI